jgi:hypothetical protein
MRRLSVLIATLGLLLLAAPAIAQTGTITIELTGVITDATEGEVRLLVSEPVAAELVGASCDGSLTTDNNGSVHPGNTLIVTTGGETAEIPEVESSPGQMLEFFGEGVIVGETIDISMRFGRNGITSGGITLVLDCAQPAETTTTTAAPEQTTTTTAAPEQTTTTTAAPEQTTTTATPSGGVASGAGGSANGTPSPLPFLGATALFAALAVGLWAWKGGTEG